MPQIITNTADTHKGHNEHPPCWRELIARAYYICRAIY